MYDSKIALVNCWCCMSFADPIRSCCCHPVLMRVRLNNQSAPSSRGSSPVVTPSTKKKHRGPVSRTTPPSRSGWSKVGVGVVALCMCNCVLITGIAGVLLVRGGVPTTRVALRDDILSLEQELKRDARVIGSEVHKDVAWLKARRAANAETKRRAAIDATAALSQEKPRAAALGAASAPASASTLASSPASALGALRYWRNTAQQVQPNPWDRFLTFDSDCGGFNNLRIALEWFVTVAWLTRRTLVLPPRHPWYLIDNGPIAVKEMKTTGGGGERVSDYCDFFNCDALRAAVPVIRAEEWVRWAEKRPEYAAVAASGALPQRQSRQASAWKMNHAERAKWQTFLVSGAAGNAMNLPWGHYDGYLDWQRSATLEGTAATVSSAFTARGARKPFVYTDAMRSSAIVHFPSCNAKLGEAIHNGMAFRYLGQIAVAVAFGGDSAGKALMASSHALLRDSVRFVDEVWETAAKVVGVMGEFKFSTLHIRRNELQYKSSFSTAQTTLGHIAPLLARNEALYIATDEKDEGFFQAIEAKHKVYRWKDFNEQTRGVNPKLIGLIEQAICAMGRVFVGTRDSTFSSYIVRLRGYIGAPDTGIYVHTDQYVADGLANRAINGHLTGHDYKMEWHESWDDLVRPSAR